MAVIVRSVPRSGAALVARAGRGGCTRRGSRASGVRRSPNNRRSRALLTVLGATADGLDGDRALDLLTGPIGRVDPVSLRQLRRTLRRADRSQPPRDFGDLLVDALERNAVELSGAACPSAAAGARSARPPRGAASPTARTRASRCGRRGTTPGLQRRWLSASRARRHGGAQAGARPRRRHRAVRRRRAVRRADRRGHRLRGLVDHVRAHGAARRRPWRPAGRRRRRHGAERARRARPRVGLRRDRRTAGRLVAQHVPRGGVLGTQQLVDVLDGVAREAGVSTRAPLLAEERRLLIAAMGRARTHAAGDRGRQRQRRRRDAAVAVLRRTRRAGHRTATRQADVEPVRAPRVLAPARGGRPAARGGVRTRRTRSVTTYGPVPQRNWRGSPRPAWPGADPAQWYGTTAHVHRRTAVVGRRPRGDGCRRRRCRR